MCLSLALGVASTIASSMAAQEAANRQNQAYYQNAANANSSAVEQYAQNNLQKIQEEAKATQERMANKVEVLKTKGTAKASTENEGSSVLSTLNDIERQGAKNENIISVNVKNAGLQADTNAKAIQQETQGRIDSVGTATGPSLLQTAVSGLGNIAPYVGNSKYKARDHKGSVTNG